ncbi:MAG: hypothetical protein WD294_03930 [Phycisphaeraceae bacterium]
MSKGGHKQKRRRKWLDVRAAVASGVIVGLLFCTAELAFASLFGDGAWGPLRNIAAIALGPEVLENPAAAPGPAIAALALHLK